MDEKFPEPVMVYTDRASYTEDVAVDTEYTRYDTAGALRSVKILSERGDDLAVRLDTHMGVTRVYADPTTPLPCGGCGATGPWLIDDVAFWCPACGGGQWNGAKA